MIKQVQAKHLWTPRARARSIISSQVKQIHNNSYERLKICSDLLCYYRSSCWRDSCRICNWFCFLNVSFTFISLILNCHSGTTLVFLYRVATYTTFPAITQKVFLFCWFLSDIFDWLYTFKCEVVSAITLISVIVQYSLYTSPSYVLSFNKLWCARLNASARVFNVFAPRYSSLTIFII